MKKRVHLVSIATHLGVAILLLGCGGDGTSPPAEPVIVSLSTTTTTIIGIGQTASLQATVTGVKSGIAAISWSTSNASVVEVAATGGSATLTSRGRGSATVTATVGSTSASASIQVQADLRSVSIPQPVVALGVGNKATVAASVDADPGITVTYTWTSESAQIATVAATAGSAEITAVAPGLTRVFVEARSQFGESRRDTVNVSVVGYTASLEPSTLDLKEGETRRVRVVVQDNEGHTIVPHNLTFTSSPSGYLTVEPKVGAEAEFNVRASAPGSGAIIVHTEYEHPPLSISVRASACVRSGEELIWPVCGDDRGLATRDYAEFGPTATSLGVHHTGLDIAGAEGEPVFAAAGGTVVLVQVLDAPGCAGTSSGCRDRGLGNSVIIKHQIAGRDTYTQYSHLSAIDRDLLDLCANHGAAGERCTLSQPIASSRNVGWIGRSGNGSPSALSSPLLHVELKDRPVLHNPTNGVVDTPLDEGTCAPGVCTWEFEGETKGGAFHPDRFGYRDPKSLLLASTDLRDSVLAERVVVSAGGAGQEIRLGPGAFPATAEMTVAGAGFTLLLRSAPTLGCSSGWLKIAKDDGAYFATSGARSSPDGWICGGDGGTSYGSTPSLLAESVFGTTTELYEVEIKHHGAERLVRQIASPFVSDLARTPDGVLYGVTPTELIRIDTLTGAATVLAAYSTQGIGSFTGLVAKSNGRLLLGSQVGALLEVNPTNPQQATVVGQLTGNSIWGDMTYGPEGDLYVSAYNSQGGALLRADPATFAIRSSVQYAPLGGGSVWGLAFSGLQLVGLVWDSATAGRMVRIDPVTGSVTPIRALSFGPGGATRRAPPSTQLPAALIGRTPSGPRPAIGERIPVVPRR